MWRVFFLSVTIGIAFLFVQTEQVKAQLPELNNVRVNFAYTFLDLQFGFYEVGGVDADVFQIPISHTFDLQKHEKLKLKIEAPFYYGYFKFKEKVNEVFTIKADQHLIALIPGVELQYEALDNWYLKPFGRFGLVKSIGDNISPSLPGIMVSNVFIYVYSVGLRSLYEIFWERFKFSIGNAILFSGDTSFRKGIPHNLFGSLENGVEVLHPLGFNLGGYEPDISAFFIYYHYMSDVEFVRLLDAPERLKNQYEIGGTIGSATPSKLWIINNPRIGVGYRFGDVEALTINFGFPF